MSEMATLQASLRANKKALRKAMGVTLRALSPSHIQVSSQSVTKRILSTPFFHRCKTVSCYLSMPTGEVDTFPLVSEILRTGKTLFIPKIVGDQMKFLKLYGEDDLRSLPSGLWGIKDPDSHWQGEERLDVMVAEAPPLDLILLPGVAFDRSFSRLGHGKGYYDRFLTSYITPDRRPPLLVALALREQVLDAGGVPIGNYDWKVDVIASPDELITSSSATLAE